MVLGRFRERSRAPTPSKTHRPEVGGQRKPERGTWRRETTGSSSERMRERVQYSRDGRCRQNLLDKIFKVRSWSLGVIKTVAGPKRNKMRTNGLEGSGRGAVGRCRVRFVGCGNRGAAAGVGGQPAAARRGVGITPDSVKAPHVYASRGVTESPLKQVGQGRAGQGKARQAHLQRTPRDGTGNVWRQQRGASGQGGEGCQGSGTYADWGEQRRWWEGGGGRGRARQG